MKGEKRKRKKKVFPVSPSPSLPLSLPLQHCCRLSLSSPPPLVLQYFWGDLQVEIIRPFRSLLLPASAQSAATKRFRWKRGFGAKREMIAPRKRAALSMCAHVLSFACTGCTHKCKACACRARAHTHSHTQHTAATCRAAPPHSHLLPSSTLLNFPAPLSPALCLSLLLTLSC